MKWVNVNEKYLEFLRNFEARIPYTDYGNNKYKPFFGILFEVGDFYYITQVSHPQGRHIKMKQQKDFFKIYDSKEPSRLIAVINLNYMFPILKTEVSDFEKGKMDTYRTFSSEKEKSKYLDLLDTEMRAINSLGISDAAKDLYNSKYAYPNSKIAKRCLDYKYLEKQGCEWK